MQNIPIPKRVAYDSHKTLSLTSFDFLKIFIIFIKPNYEVKAMRPEHIKVGNKANPEGFKQLGYKRLSSSTWIKDRLKVQLVGKRIVDIQTQRRFSQLVTDFKTKNNKHEQLAKQVLKCLR